MVNRRHEDMRPTPKYPVGTVIRAKASERKFVVSKVEGPYSFGAMMFHLTPLDGKDGLVSTLRDSGWDILEVPDVG